MNDHVVLTPHGVVRCERVIDAECVRSINHERQKWQDAALSGGLPERLPRVIDRDVLGKWLSQSGGRVDVINLLEGGPKERTGPLYGGKYAAVSMVGWADEFEGIILPTFIMERVFNDVVWYVLTDDSETWEQTQSHCVLPAGDIDNPKFGLEFPKKHKDFLKGVVSPSLMQWDDSLTVEVHGQRPIVGTWYDDDQEMEALMGIAMDRPLSGWLMEGEVAIPLMPKYPKEWYEKRVENGPVYKSYAQQFEAEFFTLEREDFLNLVAEHQKACNRFAHALWAVNFANEEGETL